MRANSRLTWMRRNLMKRGTPWRIAVPKVEGNRAQMGRTILNSLLFALVMNFWSDGPNNQPRAFPKEALPTESGYLAVNGKSGARMYYAYHEAISPSDQDLSKIPILLWLEGGPGCSGMIGNFYEIGPWRIGEDTNLHKNPTPWNRLFGVLFLDNPVGTGFSVAESVQDIPTDQEQVARDVYTALQGFFDINPAFRSRPFYVTGESYGGKYVPSVALYLITHEKPLRVDGVAMGNGLTHPVVQVQSHASVAYALGLIDSLQKFQLEDLQQRAVALVRQRKWRDAYVARSRALEWLQNVTGLPTLLDTRRTSPYYTSSNGTDYVTPFLNQPSVREALNAELNITWQDCSNVVLDRMGEDIMKSTKWKVEVLLGRMPVMVYQGLFDLLDGVLSTEEWMNSLNWSGLQDFLASPRETWKVDKKLAGYVRTHSNLTHVVVAGAGHLVAADQSFHSQIMIESWVRRMPF